MPVIVPAHPQSPDVDRGPALLSMFWTWTAISIVLVTLRFYVRSRMGSRGLDDWMMLLSVAFFIVTSSFVTYMASIGGSRHVWFLGEAETLRALEWSWISQPPTFALFATSKMSIACFQLRLIKRTHVWRRYIIYGVIAAALVANLLTLIIIFVQCNPSRALWTPNIGGQCWDPDVLLYITYLPSALNILVDVVLAVLPSTFIPTLALPVKKKVGLCVLLGFGIIAAVFGAVKTCYLRALTERGDFTWNAYPVQAWSGAESFVLIFSGSLPPLQPLWHCLVNKKPLPSSRRARHAVGDGVSKKARCTLEPRPPAAVSFDRQVLLEPPPAKHILATTHITISREAQSQ